MHPEFRPKDFKSASYISSERERKRERGVERENDREREGEREGREDVYV